MLIIMKSFQEAAKKNLHWMSSTNISAIQVLWQEGIDMAIEHCNTKKIMTACTLLKRKGLEVNENFSIIEKGSDWMHI